MNVPELSRGARQLGWTSCLTSPGRPGNPGRRDNFSSYKHFGSPNRDHSWCGECHLGLKAEICIKEVTIKSANPTVIERVIFAHLIIQ